MKDDRSMNYVSESDDGDQKNGFESSLGGWMEVFGSQMEVQCVGERVKENPSCLACSASGKERLRFQQDGNLAVQW